MTDRFLHSLWSQLESDPSWALAMSEEQMSQARTAIERAVVSLTYTHAMYPNGEADVHRDQVLFDHMGRLGAVITPGHRDLKIPREYRYEHPWPSAQAEIRRLAAYKTASEKVACIVR